MSDTIMDLIVHGNTKPPHEQIIQPGFGRAFSCAE